MPQTTSLTDFQKMLLWHAEIASIYATFRINYAVAHLQLNSRLLIFAVIYV